MVSYARLGTKIWRSVAASSETAHRQRKEDIAYLDFQVQQWQQSIPEKHRLTPVTLEVSSKFDRRARANYRRAVMLQVRALQMRITIHRSVVFSAESIAEDFDRAELAVNLAKEIIHLLDQLDQTTDIYRSQQRSFNYFLISALAILLLAACNAPGQFNQRFNDEYYMALNLVEGLQVSTQSTISQRLWDTIKDLKTIGSELGITATQWVNFVQGLQLGSAI